MSSSPSRDRAGVQANHPEASKKLRGPCGKDKPVGMNKGQEWEELDRESSVWGGQEGLLLVLPVQHPIFLKGNLSSPSLHP